jgi:hypothetical protein
MLVRDLNGLASEMARAENLGFTREFLSELAAEMEKRIVLYSKEGKRKLARFVSQILGALHCLVADLNTKSYAGGKLNIAPESVYGYTPAKLCGDIVMHYADPGGSMGEFFLVLGTTLGKEQEMHCKTIAAHLKQAQKIVRKYHEEDRRARSARN